MLTYSAVALLIAVVVGLVSVLRIDFRRRKDAHWIDALHDWQGLLGSVLGFLSAAGVLVLGQSLQTYETQQRSDQAAHAIGLSMALEVERLAIGLKNGQQVATQLDFKAANLEQQCNAFVFALKRAVVPTTPVYDALLSNMMQFGDENLAVFVRFYGYYSELLRSLPELDATACAATPADNMNYLVTELQNGIQFYQIVANKYRDIIQPNATGAPATADDIAKG